jgi:hypothetical protein
VSLVPTPERIGVIVCLVIGWGAVAAEVFVLIDEHGLETAWPFAVIALTMVALASYLDAMDRS